MKTTSKRARLPSPRGPLPPQARRRYARQRKRVGGRHERNPRTSIRYLKYLIFVSLPLPLPRLRQPRTQQVVGMFCGGTIRSIRDTTRLTRRAWDTRTRCYREKSPGKYWKPQRRQESRQGLTPRSTRHCTDVGRYYTVHGVVCGQNSVRTASDNGLRTIRTLPSRLSTKNNKSLYRTDTRRRITIRLASQCAVI